MISMLYLVIFLKSLKITIERGPKRETIINMGVRGLNYGEGVGTSKIRTTKGQNVKSIFRMIRISKVKKIRTSKVFSERRKSLHQKVRRKSENVRLSTF